MRIFCEPWDVHFITVNCNSTTDVASSVSVPWVFLPSVVSLWSLQCSSCIQWSFPSHVVISVVLCEKALAVQGVCVRVCGSTCESLSASVFIFVYLKTENTGMVRSELPGYVCKWLHSVKFFSFLYFSLIVGNMFVHHLLTFRLIVLQFGKFGANDNFCVRLIFF